MFRSCRALMCALTLFAIIAAGGTRAARAAEVTTGALTGTVVSTDGQPISDAVITIAAPAGRYETHTDPHGRFTLVGIVPDTYALSVEVAGYESFIQRGVTVTAAQPGHVTIRLAPLLRTIGSVRASGAAFVVGSTTDTFTVSGDAARATAPSENGSGLAQYNAGTVQGAIASAPGVDVDTFGNAILRGGKVSDAVFDYDSVPVPQGLIAEPGGNIVGAQLSTVGVAATTVTLGGFGSESQNALAGVIDEIPLTGTYPQRQTLELGTGIGTQYDAFRWQNQWATPDLRWRFAFSTDLSSEYFAYGDGRTFYPSEEGTYGLALQSRGESASAGNVHFALTPHDDLSFVGLYGEASYQQYGLPYPGLTVGSFDCNPNLTDCSATKYATYPGESNPNLPVGYASGLTGTYDILKLGWAHTSAQAVSRLQLYQSQFGSQAGGPFWDDLSFPDGIISLFTHQGGRENGVLYDVLNVASDRNRVDYGVAYRENNSFLDQIVPTADEYIHSNPTLFTGLAYLGDTWTVAPRLDASGTARFERTHIVPSDGTPYDVAAIDPHLGFAYRVGGDYAVRATFDHTTVAPAPLETDRSDSTNPAPFVALAPEITNDEAISFEGRGRTQFRLTYYAEHESNRIDVLPSNFRSVVAGDQSPSGIGVPSNAGALLGHGLELWGKTGNFSLDANYLRAYSSSASQFAYNDLNPAAIAANALIPLSYVPDFSALLSYEVRVTSRFRVTPEVSFESGYPYGNGTMIYEFVNGKAVLVPNDNYLNPGYNYYFLENPGAPYNAQTNPYVASLGTPEGPLPNSLHAPPQTLLSLHAEFDITPRLTAIFDVANLLGTASPTDYQSNPYLIGPPGYKGTANPNSPYAIWYGQQLAGTPYLLGNGVPTNDGQTQAVPWNYGTAGYVPQGYPLARTFELKLRYRM
ncbi:MAG TPA: TonB-dependent receptor [Candidatus Sulfotelmatobacter sp.]|nr:TonB-dependent receptor [Candidatus Sulfotelmatobacter sp.]